MDLDQAAAHAAQQVRAMPPGTRWFLACDSDADGVCAAAVMAQALRRIGHGVQARASRQKDAAYYAGLAEVACDAYMLLDKGSSHAAALEELAIRSERPVLVIDHHTLPSDVPGGITIVNPRALGLDGSRDASASTTAAAVAIALDPANLALAGTALAGAVGDWQHRGGWQGWNLRLLDDAAAAGHLERRHQPALVGVDLADALARAGVPGIDAPEQARAFLAPLGLADAADAEDLDREQQARLVSAVALQHARHGQAPGPLTWDALWDRRLGVGVRHLFRLVDACSRRGEADLAFAYLLGDAAARPAVEEAFRRYAQALRRAMDRLQSEGTTMRQACQVAWTDDPSLTGMVGGMGMTHFLADRERPAVVLARRPDGEVQVSTRGTNEAVARGLDLGAAVAAAASEVGRDGGGHPVAAGAVIEPLHVDAFLAALDAQLAAQGFLPDTL